MRQQIAPAAAAGGAAAQAAQAAPTTFEREPERAPTVSARPPGELGLADLYTQRVQQGRAPASPRDHIIFGGNRSEVQAGTKFASGGFPYLFVIVRVQRSVPTHHTHTLVGPRDPCTALPWETAVFSDTAHVVYFWPQAMMLWFGWKFVLWLAMHGVSWKLVGAFLMFLCCAPLIAQVVMPSTNYEINLGATLQYAARPRLAPLALPLPHLNRPSTSHHHATTTRAGNARTARSRTRSSIGGGRRRTEPRAAAARPAGPRPCRGTQTGR